MTKFLPDTVLILSGIDLENCAGVYHNSVLAPPSVCVRKPYMRGETSTRFLS